MIKSSPETCRAIGELALKVVSHARRHGLTLIAMRSSRIHRSPSMHIVLRDGRARDWQLRVSNHYCPRKTGHPVPHFDLVSADGVIGAGRALAFVEKLSRGEVAWTAPICSPKRKGQR